MIRSSVCVALVALLLATTPIIVFGNVSYAEAADEQAQVNTPPSAATTSSDSGEVGAASGSNRFVVWIDETPGNPDIFFRRSTDNGATWKAIVNLSKNPGDSDSPQVAVSGSNVYVVWTQRNAAGTLVDIFLRQSPDNGATWNPFVNISDNNAGGSFDPQIAVSGSNVYVVWVDSTPGNFDTLFRRSTDNGATWKSITNLSKNAGESLTLEIAVSGSNLYVAWGDKTTGNFDILFRRSTDNGATWKTVKNLSNNAAHSINPQLAFSGSNVYIVWSNGGGRIELLFRLSTDSGATWNAVKFLTNNVSANGLANPQLAASDSNVYLLWSEINNKGPVGSFLRRSTDNGVTWKPTVEIGEIGLSQGPQLAVYGSNVYVVFFKPEGPAIFDLLLKRSTDGGATWKSIVNLRNNSDISHRIHIAVAGSNAYVAWSENSLGNLDIFLRRSTDGGATWNAVKTMSNNAGKSVGPVIGV